MPEVNKSGFYDTLVFFFRNLGNFSSNLIQKKINMFVTLDMCTCDLNVMSI